MNQPRQPPRGGQGGVGSVRAARERAQAGNTTELSSPPRQRPYDQTGPPSNRSIPQMQTGFSGGRNNLRQTGVPTSRQPQVPQWPLGGGMDSGSSNQYQPPAGRGIAPQRPPRPSVVPAMLDPSRAQDSTPTFQYSPAEPSPNQLSRGDYYEDNGFQSPDIISPTTGSSIYSNVSSVGSIPDFPIPAIPQYLPIQGARRSGSLGPPPSSRRGAASYYSQQSFVSPIPEESPRTALVPSHLSYASSAAIPPVWPRSPSSPGFGYDDYDDYYDRDRASPGQITDDGRISRGSTADDSDDRGLIRSASIGKRAKPSMVTTKSFEKQDSSRSTITPQPLKTQKSQQNSAIGLGLAAPQMNGDQRQTFWPSIEGSEPRSMPMEPEPVKLNSGGQRHTAWPMIGNADSPLAGGTGLIDPTPSTSAESVPTLSNLSGVKAKRNSTSDPSQNPILGAYNAASALNPGLSQSRERSPSTFSRFSALRRPPPRLDIDAVRDAEARGSLTSLPDLIRRATKLAAMMDRGKRPGSRMNDLSDFPSDIDLSSRYKESPPGANRSSGFSGMINAFPAAGLGTPREGTPRPQSSWPMGFTGTGSEKDNNQSTRPRKAGRRCFGMPCWLFFLLSLILLLVIAAAIVIPLYFFVIKKNASAASLTPLQQCQSDTTTSCQNGGVASLSTGSCSCICINGFTGSTCTVPDAGACSTISLADTSLTTSSVANATLGDAIPRLITSSRANFSIPLSESLLLSRFNTAALSCVSQNALVTFNGQSTRLAAVSKTVAIKLRRRQISSSTTSSAEPAVGTATSGIIFDTSNAAPPPSSSSAPIQFDSSSAIFDDTALFNITPSVLDFSRVAVLFLFQEESLDNAVLAQGKLQTFLGSTTLYNAAARNVTLGGGNSVDLLRFMLAVGKKGEIVGGRNVVKA